MTTTPGRWQDRVTMKPEQELEALKREAAPLILSGEVQLVDKSEPKYEDPYDTPEYQAFVEEMAKDCRCEPFSVRPCDGLLAGGLCDQMDWRDQGDEEEGKWQDEKDKG